MPFPEVPRIIYNKNPINQVICQFKFPPILRIESGIIPDFQEMINDDYPEMKEKNECAIPIVMPQGMQQSPETIQNISMNKNYEFSSEDGIWKVNLTRNFLAISTTQYTRWEDFIAKCQHPFQALLKYYPPQFFNRIGLRYVDFFIRSKLGLSDKDKWTNLIQPYMLGLLSSPLDVEIGASGLIAEIPLKDKESIVRINASIVQQIIPPEQCYMVDSDFICSKKVTIENALSKLDFLHSRATRLIQWMITPELHRAMEPREI